ncbi:MULTISPECIES: MOSC domain-containing protein [Subtercola]|uniref:MOSC domain-containing protein n=1 Tax=Subtercola vilae TaxID=2056433 RepID=A0A4T2BUW1_9MICO|nr:MULTISPECIES: MOSC domain-containing protein [Subtercola]MEA9984687.1 MOSC domain-containing protein [Subtercola sp. RTI3]TIH35277.1 MOSC domain-containing protein [Subtercola vilae]
MAELLAACVVHQLIADAGSVGTTAIDKRPVEGPVRVRKLGLHADVQASRNHHGGEAKALYVYAQEDADYWQRELNRPLAAGWFGENLRVSGVDISGARVGERWQIGERVVVEVTSPRSPCATFARWVGGPDARGWVKRFSDARRLGAYLRVVTAGEIEAGDAIVVLSVPAGAPTITEVYVG